MISVVFYLSDRQDLLRARGNKSFITCHTSHTKHGMEEENIKKTVALL